MAHELNFESDTLARLLTDALRAGPGSPQWHEATQRLAGDSSEQAGEYRQIMEARQRLESGRNYRSVRAGPGFTRRLMSRIDAEPDADAAARWARWLPPAGYIAIFSAILALGALAAMVYFLLPRAPSPAPLGASAGIERLASLYMVETVTSATFDAAGPPPGWKPIGAMRMSFSRGMRPLSSSSGGGATDEPATQNAEGGIAWGQPFDPRSPFAIEVTIRAARAADDLVPEIVIAEHDPADTATADTAADTAAPLAPGGASAARELVWLLKDGRSAVVLPGGSVESQPPRARDPSQLMTVRLTLDRENAIVEINGQRAWAGQHMLSPDKPRYAALRFIRRKSDKPEATIFQSVRIQRTAAP